MGEKKYHKRLTSFESFDRIELIVEPRFKTSGMSGDEWRTGVAVKFWFKGEVVHDTFFTSMRAALWMLGHEWVTQQEPIPERVLELERLRCDQPGCQKMAVVVYDILQEFSDRGERLDPDDCHLQLYRKFCKEHSQRGDCSREDCDANYRKVPDA